MTTILPVSNYPNYSISQNNKNKPKRKLYLNMNQSEILSIGTISASLGVIRSAYAYDELKTTAKYPLRGSLFQGAVTMAAMAALFALFKIRYGENKKL